MKNLIDYKIFESKKSLDYILDNYDDERWVSDSMSSYDTSDYVEHFLQLNLDEVKQLYRFYAKLFHQYTDHHWNWKPTKREYQQNTKVDQVKLLTRLAIEGKKDIFEFIITLSRIGTGVQIRNIDKLFKSLADHLPDSMPYIDFMIQQGYKPAALAMKKIYGTYDWTQSQMYKDLVNPMKFNFNDVTTDRMRKNGTLRLQDQTIKTFYRWHADPTAFKYEVYGFSIDGRLRRIETDKAQLIDQTKINVVDEESANLLFNKFLNYYYYKTIRENSNTLSVYLDKHLLRRKPKRKADWRQIEEFWQLVMKDQPKITSKITVLPLNVYPDEIKELIHSKFMNIEDIKTHFLD